MMQRGDVWRQLPAVLTDEITALQRTYLSFQKNTKTTLHLFFNAFCLISINFFDI